MAQAMLFPMTNVLHFTSVLSEVCAQCLDVFSSYVTQVSTEWRRLRPEHSRPTERVARTHLT